MSKARERVFILAASKDQAALFADRWLAEDPTRRRQDAIYLGLRILDGHRIEAADRIVGVEGYERHPRARQITDWLRRTLAKTGRPFEIEPVTT